VSNTLPGGSVLPATLPISQLSPHSKFVDLKCSAAVGALEVVQWATDGVTIEPSDASGTLGCYAGVASEAGAIGDTIRVLVGGYISIAKNTGAAIAAGDAVVCATGKAVSTRPNTSTASALGTCLIAAGSGDATATIWLGF